MLLRIETDATYNLRSVVVTPYMYNSLWTTLSLKRHVYVRNKSDADWQQATAGFILGSPIFTQGMRSVGVCI